MTAGLDNHINKYVTRIPSARSSSYAVSCFPLSSRSTPSRSSISATSIFSSQGHQGRLPDDLQEDAPSRPKLQVYPKNKHNCPFRDLPGHWGAGACFALQSKNPLHLIGSGAEHLSKTAAPATSASRRYSLLSIAFGLKLCSSLFRIPIHVNLINL